MATAKKRPSELERLKRKTVQVAMRYAADNGWCDTVTEALVEIGLGKYLPSRLIIQVKHGKSDDWSLEDVLQIEEFREHYPDDASDEPIIRSDAATRKAALEAATETAVDYRVRATQRQVSPDTPRQEQIFISAWANEHNVDEVRRQLQEQTERLDAYVATLAEHAASKQRAPRPKVYPKYRILEVPADVETYGVDDKNSKLLLTPEEIFAAAEKQRKDALA